jgi:hypothetical protein
MTDLVATASLEETIRLANALAKSGYYKDIRDVAQGVVKLQIAREMGLGMRGISDVHIVEGKPTLSYQLILSKVRMFTGPRGDDRYNYKYTRRDDTCVSIEWFINGESLGESKCDTDDAKRMGLAGRPTWQKYPRQMRTARAVTEGVNAYMPEVVGQSIYTPEELMHDDPISHPVMAVAALPAPEPPTIVVQTPDDAEVVEVIDSPVPSVDEDDREYSDEH